MIFFSFPAPQGDVRKVTGVCHSQDGRLANLEKSRKFFGRL